MGYVTEVMAESRLAERIALNNLYWAKIMIGAHVDAVKEELVSDASSTLCWLR